MKSRALGAIVAQGVQAGISFVLQVLVARTLGIEELGRFAILYGVIVVVTGIVTGVVGDSLVVLDRARGSIRSALQGTTLVLAGGGGVIGAGVFLIVGLITPLEALLFALTTALFTTEEVLRRLLMAHLAFFRVVAADLAGFAVALAVVLGAAAASASSLSFFLGAICAGQAVAIVCAALLLPRDERRWASFERGGLREVLDYGTWRGLQQLLRPALLTVVRLLVGAFAGLAAVGLLEAARVYVAPALLAVGGLTSFLFVRYAHDRGRPIRAIVRRADLTVLVLVAGTAVLGVIAVLLLPWLGPILFTVQPPTDAVIGWLAFTAAVAATTPYGTLAAVHGGQRQVFGLRLADSLVSVAAVVALLLTAGTVVWVPVVLAAGALLGGVAIRLLVLVPLSRETSPDADGSPESPSFS